MSEAKEITVFAQVDSSGKWNVCNESFNCPLNQEEIIQCLQPSTLIENLNWMNMDISRDIVDSKHRPEMQGLKYSLLFN